MYGVFDSQFLPMKVAFAREGTDIDVAYTPNGEVDYLYRTGRLLAVDDPEVLARLERVLPGVRRTAEEERDAALPGLVILSIEEVEPGFLTVPQAMELIDEAFGGEEGGEGGGKGDGPWESSARVTEEERWPVSPLHVMHLKDGRLCEATEPEVPCCGHRRKGGKGEGEPCPPCPPRAGNGGEGLLIGVCDTGLLAGLDLGQVPWLGGVTGDPDPLGPALPGGAPSIPKYTGHGTFVSGVARCEAPGAAVHVARLFMKDGGEFEHVIARRLWQIFAGDLTNGRVPALVNLSAGGYTRKNRPPLSFNAFFRHHPGVTLTAAAGNDSICRPFWPAASRHAIGVGAPGAHQRARVQQLRRLGRRVRAGRGAGQRVRDRRVHLPGAATAPCGAGLRRDGPVERHLVLRAAGRGPDRLADDRGQHAGGRRRLGPAAAGRRGRDPGCRPGPLSPRAVTCPGGPPGTGKRLGLPGNARGRSG
jgi:hypothetical protein